MADITSIMGGEYRGESEQFDTLDVQVRRCMVGAGLEPPDSIIPDGKIHRFSTNGKKGDDAGWYVIYPEGVAAGKVGCWRDNIEVKFVADIGRELTVAEQMAVARRQAEATEVRRAQQAKKREAAESVVAKIWPDMGAASADHEYLKRKGIQPNGARIASDGRLALPIYGPDNELMSIQYIAGDSSKRFHTGASTKDGHWLIGTLDGYDGNVYIGEGFATCATIHEVMNAPCYVAYSSGNLHSVAAYVKNLISNPIVIVGDNDEHGSGQAKAEEAARAVSARVVIPDEIGDANDYYQNGYDLKGLLAPPIQGWVVSGIDFIKEQSHVKWLCKNIIPQESMVMTHGPSGSGKTFAVLDIALHIAYGMEWQGHKVTQAPVLYLAGEGHNGLRGRIMAWVQTNGLGMDHMLNQFFVSQSAIDLNTPQGIEKVVNSIDALPFKPWLIIVDTIHRHMDGDENSAKDTKTMLDACDFLQKKYNATSWLVHHVGNSEETQHRARGSSAWRGALDMEYSITPAKDSNPMEMAQVKNKDGEAIANKFMRIEGVKLPWLDEDGENIWSAVITHEAEYVKPKKEPRQITNAKKTFELAWTDSGTGECDSNGNPWLSRDALKSYLEGLIETGNLKKPTVDNYLKPAYEKGPIYILTSAKVIEKIGDGWSAIDGDFSTILSLGSAV